MAATLTIRLRERDREILEEAAKRTGSGLSSYVRQLAEAEAKRLLYEEIRRESERVAECVATHPELRAELEMYGTPQYDLPDETFD